MDYVYDDDIVCVCVCVFLVLGRVKRKDESVRRDRKKYIKCLAISCSWACDRSANFLPRHGSRAELKLPVEQTFSLCGPTAPLPRPSPRREARQTGKLRHRRAPRTSRHQKHCRTHALVRTFGVEFFPH